MSIELITGHAGTPHIDSEDARAMNRGIFGNGNYILEGSDPESIIPAVTVRVPALELMLNGSHARTTGTDTVSFSSTSQGMRRFDYIVARYRVNGAIESMEIDVVEGTASKVDPQLPTLVRTSTIYEYPLYLAMINTATVESIQCVLGKLLSMDTYNNSALPVEKGGTGAKDAASARRNLGLNSMMGWQWVISDKFTVNELNGSALVTMRLPEMRGYTPVSIYGYTLNNDGTPGSYDYMFDINNIFVNRDSGTVEAQIINRFNGENHGTLGVGVNYIRNT